MWPSRQLRARDPRARRQHRIRRHARRLRRTGRRRRGGDRAAGHRTLQRLFARIGRCHVRGYGAEHSAKLRPVRQSLVRTHPVTGRKSLYLSAHIGTIVGWPVPEARAFIRDLTEHATQPRFMHVHAWRQRDLVIWDNRTTMHRARRYNDRGGSVRPPPLHHSRRRPHRGAGCRSGVMACLASLVGRGWGVAKRPAGCPTLQRPPARGGRTHAITRSASPRPTDRAVAAARRLARTPDSRRRGRCPDRDTAAACRAPASDPTG